MSERMHASKQVSVSMHASHAQTHTQTHDPLKDKEGFVGRFC